MLRGIGYFVTQGDDWYPSLTPGNVVIDWTIPAGNKGTLDMLGAGPIIGASWATTTKPILDHLDAISVAFEELVGAPLDWVACDTSVWTAVLSNQQVRDQAGTANTVFETYEMSNQRSKDGAKTGLRYGVLKARPWIKWHVTNAGLNLQVSGNSVYTKFSPGGEASFGIDVNLGFVKMQEGSELVKESPWDTGKDQRGLIPGFVSGMSPPASSCTRSRTSCPS